MSFLNNPLAQLFLPAMAALFLAGCPGNSASENTPASPAPAETTAESPAAPAMQKTNSGAAEAAPADASPAGKEEAAKTDPSAPKKVLVAYYSWGGNTKVVAEYIHKAVGGTLFEITPKEPYSTTYAVVVAKAKLEISGGEGREITATVPDFASYDAVFLGTPNWWGTMAPPVKTFMASHPVDGKKIYPFVTHGSGGLQNVLSDMKKFAPKADISDNPLVLLGDDVKKSETDVHTWLRKIGF